MSRGLSRGGCTSIESLAFRPHLHLEHVAGVDDAQTLYDASRSSPS